MQFTAALIVGAICSLNVLWAQISVPGRYRHLVHDSLKKSGTIDTLKEYSLPEQNNAQLEAQAEADEAKINAKTSRKVISSDGTEEIIYTDKPPKAAPYQFGQVIDFVVKLEKEDEGQWTVNEETGTKMWRFKVYSKDAHSVSIYFSDFYLAPTSELYIIGQEDTLGAFTSQNNKEDRVFGIAPVSGDYLILEYIEPLTISESSSFVVSHIVHGFRSSPFSLKAGSAAGNCHFNVACQEGAGKTDSINSVALLINGKGNSFCTGAMINNAMRDGRQLFLTAEHCIGDEDASNIKNYMIGFHYQYKYCSSSFESKPQIKTVHGTKLLDKSDISDYALLEVVESIPDEWDVFMAGWDASPLASRTGSYYGIHHPRGDTKKVSLYTGQLEMVRLSDVSDGINFWRVKKWEKGVTEPGSSGSPLFDSNGLIVGHLFGGESNCNRQKSPDYYGALSRDWVLKSKPIVHFLDPNSTNGVKLSGAPLKQLRGREDPVEEPIRNAPTSPVVRTEIVTVTQTIAKTTITVTDLHTKTLKGDRTTLTKEVPVTVTTSVTVTSTFTRVPPAVTHTRTITIRNYYLASGQVQQKGRFNSKARQIFLGKNADSGMNGSRFKIQVPFHDSKVLLAADEALKSISTVHSTPLTFAKAIPLGIDSRSDGIWEEDANSNVRTWSLFIESKTAIGMALIFDNFHIFEGGEMFVMNESGILGAFTRANNKPDGKFSIQPLKGSNIFIVYIEPLKSVKPLNYFKIGKVVHAYRDIFNQDKAISGTCNVDVKCINSFNDQKKATIVFMTDQLQKFCTGAMINNAKGDGRQLLLTANHCVFTDLSNSIAGFNYERLGCSSSASISEPLTAHGMKLLARASTSDFALFEVIEKIPQSYNVYLSGWDANIPNLGISDTFAGIHHPSGDVKKISLYNGKIQLSSWSEGPGKNYHVTIPKWTRGVTEPGSSGSPLFNSKGNLIGQLHGGASSCGNLEGADLYGGFAFSFGDNGSGISLKTILDSNNLIKSLILPGRNLYSGSTSTIPSSTSTMVSTRTITTTSTVTSIVNTCQCVPKGIVDKLIQSYEYRIKLLEN